ncbi:MAG TPA: cytochrome c biogenesis protein CcsA [Anaeromyxobacteraceae bacterium]|jgi:ABC-type transport system involved in cytochrome c biogenesis permease subunit|nr:cytochrome c biogenesis protein CcsA [Anaeromyxobacteraceae bacterium]
MFPETALAIAALFAALAAAVAGLTQRERPSRYLLGTAALVATLGAIARGLFAGHLPKFGTFEESLACSAVILLHAAWVARLRGRAVPAGVAALVAALLLAHGLVFPRERLPLTISEQSGWLDLHVFAAWLTSAAFALAAGGSAWILARGGETAEAFLTRSLQVGFLFHSALMVLGAWYGLRLFGRAFSLDPVELLAVIAWLTEASVLHLRAYRGLRGARYAALGLTAVILLLLSFRLVVHLRPTSTYHVIDMALRIHS